MVREHYCPPAAASATKSIRNTQLVDDSHRMRSGRRPAPAAGGPLLALLSMPAASRRAFSFAAFSLVASLRRSAAPESQFVNDAAIARVIAEQKTASRRRDRIAAEVTAWEDKAKLAVSKGRDDLAKAALQERRAVEDTLRVVEEELTTSGEHIGQLNEEIGQLQQKLDDAKAKQKTNLLRAKTASSRVQVKKQVQRDELDNAFAKFERLPHDLRDVRCNR